MDQVVDQAAAVRVVMGRVAGWLDRLRKPGVETVLVEDDRQAVYLLQRIGWDGTKRFRNVVFQARIKDGKVWIEDDNTDLTLADELMDAGVRREDIVLGFLHPDERPMSEFAVA